MALPRITVLISGRGSNLVALIDAANAGRVAGAVTQVISNRADALGLVHARTHAIATTVVEHRSFAAREAFDAALADAVTASEPDFIVLAGFMRVLDSGLVRAYAGRMINIHPSLLPLYPGMHTHRRALADGVKIHGCTVHFVTENVDVGPIIVQGAVPVHANDDEASLAARVLAVEHRILPAAVDWVCTGRVKLVDGCAQILDDATPDDALVSPRC